MPDSSQIPDARAALADLFDEGFYLSQISKVPKSPLEHYLGVGWKQGLDPAPAFSTDFYLDTHADVRASGLNPLEHYATFGRNEARKTAFSQRVDLAAWHLVKTCGLDMSLASLIMRCHQPGAMRSFAASDLAYRYLVEDWRLRESGSQPFSAGHGSGQGKPGLLSERDRTRLLDSIKALRDDGVLAGQLDALINLPWYTDQCARLSLMQPADLAMNAVDHYLSIGRFFRLSPTPLFDVAHYIDREVSGARGIDPADALIHYLRDGEAQGLRPSVFFNPGYYAECHGVPAAGALVHFVQHGAALDHQPSAAFWSAWYRRTHKTGRANPLEHFHMFGIDAGLAPHPLLDLAWYRNALKLDTDAEVVRHYVETGFIDDMAPCAILRPAHVAGMRRGGQHGTSPRETAVEHYMRHAREIDPHPLFDTGFYLSRQKNAEAIAQPLAHYLDPEAGAAKCPNPLFSDDVYVEQRPDVSLAGLSPLVHYCSTGHRETVRIHPLVDHEVLVASAAGTQADTPLEAYVSGKIDPKKPIRKMPAAPDTGNRSKWLPVALNIDRAATAHAQLPLDGVRVAILAHVFYVDLLPEVIAFARNFPEDVRLCISTDSHVKRQAILDGLQGSGLRDCVVRVFENRGRDILPSIFGFVDVLEACDYAVHIHTKQSRHYGRSFDRWRGYLFTENGGSVARVDAILRVFEANPGLGALAPVDFEPLRNLISWGYDKAMVEALLAMAGRREDLSQVSLEFPSGSMFWFRVKALRRLFGMGLGRLHFDAENGQVDGTLAHAIERAFFLLVEAEGYDWARFCGLEKLGGYRITDQIAYARCSLLPPLRSRDPVAVKLPKATMFFCRAIDNARPRLNLLIPTSDLQVGYAGVSEAVRQFRAIGDRLGSDVDLRIIATDVPFNNMTISPKGFSVCKSLVEDSDRVVVPGYLKTTEPLGLRRNDIFVASAWWTARQAFDLLDRQAAIFGVAPRRMVYLVQDFEPGFYAWSTRWAMAENSYRQPDRTIAVFNTPLLSDFMLKRYAFSLSQVYHPLINEELLIPEADRTPPQDRDRIVLLYARPHAERNCLEMIDAIVFHCMQQDPDHWADWRFLAIGEDFDTGQLRSGKIEVLGRLSLEDYRAFLGRSRLGISIMVSPHPSYPPLEMAANGVRVLTNTYGDKDLSALHENIESFDLFDPARLAAQLRVMADTPGTGQPRVDWFFNGQSNLDEVADTVAAALRLDLGLLAE